MNKKILNLAIPNIISNITIPLLGMVDLAITGHLDSNVYVGAVALGAMIFNIVYWTFSFLRMGVTGLTAQSYGAKNKPEMINTLFRGLIISVVGGLLLIIMQVPIEKFVFWIVQGSNDVEFYARQYFYIRIWAAPATISMYVFSGWFIGMQNTRIPMIIALIINGFNILFNLLFVNVLGMTSDGVALGTLIAQYMGLITAVIFLMVRYKSYFLFLDKVALFTKQKLLHFLRVNRDIFIRTMSLLTVFTFFTSKSASMNDNVLAANSMLLQFLFIFSFLTDGFAYAAEALTGRYFGEQNEYKIKQAIKLSFIWGSVLALGFTIAYFFGGVYLLKLLTNQSSIITIAKDYKFWVVLIPVASISSFIWDGVFIGLTATKHMRNSMLIAVFVVFFPVWLLTHVYLHNHALWLAFILFLFARGAAQSVIYWQKMKGQLLQIYNR